MSETNLTELPVEALEAELERRRKEDRNAILVQIGQHEKAIRDLRVKLGEGVDVAKAPARVVIPAAERKVKIMRVFDASTGLLAAGEIAQKTGVRGSTLTTTLTELVGEGKLVRMGNKRSTVYTQADAQEA